MQLGGWFADHITQAAHAALGLRSQSDCGAVATLVLIDRFGRKIIFASAQQVLEILQYLAWIEGTGIRKRWIAREFLISYTGRRTDVVPFPLVCDSKVLP
jgi:hypothetical protein